MEYNGKVHQVKYVNCPGTSCGGDNYDRSDPATREYLAIRNQDTLQGAGAIAAAGVPGALVFGGAARAGLMYALENPGTTALMVQQGMDFAEGYAVRGPYPPSPAGAAGSALSEILERYWQ